jgi:hypothetical protein
VTVTDPFSNPFYHLVRQEKENIQILEGSIHGRGTRLSQCAMCGMCSQAQSNDDHPFPCGLALVRLPVQCGRLPVLASHHDCTGTYSRLVREMSSLAACFTTVPTLPWARGCESIIQHILKYMFLYMRTEYIFTSVPHSSPSFSECNHTWRAGAAGGLA